LTLALSEIIQRFDSRLIVNRNDMLSIATHQRDCTLFTLIDMQVIFSTHGDPPSKAEPL